MQKTWLFVTTSYFTLALSGQISPREKGAEQLIQPLLKHQPMKSPTLFGKCVRSLTSSAPLLGL